MEKSNTEKVKKARKPRLPRLQRKFANLQELVKDIQEDVALTLKDARDSRKQIDPRDFDFSQLSYIELVEIQAKLGTAIIAKIKEANQ